MQTIMTFSKEELAKIFELVQTLDADKNSIVTVTRNTGFLNTSLLVTMCINHDDLSGNFTVEIK